VAVFKYSLIARRMRSAADSMAEAFPLRRHPATITGNISQKLISLEVGLRLLTKALQIGKIWLKEEYP